MRHETVETGRLITFEGGEGAGKSTQVSILVDRLKRAGRHAVATREPSGSPAAEEIRETLHKDPREDLRKRMQVAVQKEDYELAARIRDEIRRLEGRTSDQ